MESASILGEDRLLASCPHCQQIKRLEACIDCYQPMCQECMKLHVEKWRSSAIKYSQHIDQKVDKYLTKIGNLSTLTKENSARIEKVKMEIDETYRALIEKLNREKDEIFKTLDEIENENQTFKNFEKDISNLKKNIETFQDLVKTPGQYEKDKNIPNFTKFQECKNQIQLVCTNYSGLKNRAFKIIGEYEKPILIEKNFFGNLIVNESEILRTKTHNKEINKSTQQQQQQPQFQQSDKDNKVHMFGTLRVRLKRFAEQMNDFQLMFKNPIVEFSVPALPSFLAAHKNLVFIADESGNLTIAESNDDLRVKSSQKLSIMNVRGLAVNQNYLATSFADLTKESAKMLVKKFKLKKLEKKSGVMLFKWDELLVKFEKLFDLSKNESFLEPNGVSMNETNLYVCDKQLHGIYKFDLKTGDLVQQLSLNESEPTSMGIHQNLLVYVDSSKHEINLIDTERLNRVKSVKITDETIVENCVFDLASSESFLFVKNRVDSRIFVYDFDLNLKSLFEYDGCVNQGLAVFKAKSERLIVGRNVENKHFKLGYFSDF